MKRKSVALQHCTERSLATSSRHLRWRAGREGTQPRVKYVMASPSFSCLLFFFFGPFCLLLIAYCHDARMSTTLKLQHCLTDLKRGCEALSMVNACASRRAGGSAICSLSPFIVCPLSLSPVPPLVMNFADAVQTTADEIRKMADGRERERWVLPAANVFGFR